MKRRSCKWLALGVTMGSIVWTVGAAPPGRPSGPPEMTDLPSEVVADRPVYHCLRVKTPIRVDGVLNEPAWRPAPLTRRFVNSHGKGAPVGRTRLKACWDAANLYLAFLCADRDIFSPYTRRDEPLYESEVVEAFLAPSADARRYFELEVSPAGVLFDARVYNPRPQARMTVDTAWNAPGMRAAVKAQGTVNRRGDRDQGWTVEMAIPFKELELPGPVAPGDTWHVNFYRIDRGKPEEFSAWSPTLADPPSFHVPSRFGKLIFVGAGRAALKTTPSRQRE